MNLVDTLKLQTSPEVVLLNFVDCLSQWSIFIGEHIPRYVRQHFLLGEEDEQALSAYRDIRTGFGWPAHAPLLKWAQEGFPSGDYSSLLPMIEGISRVRNHEGKSLRELCEEVIPALLGVREATLREFRDLGLETVLDKIACLFPLKYNAPTVSCYLLYSPDERRTIGCANGGAISVEILLGAYRRLPLSIITHELCHLLFQCHEHYSELDDRSFIGPYSRSGFYEEAIVQSISPVTLFNVTPQSELDKIKDPEPWQIQLTQLVAVLSPLLRDYFDSESSAPKTARAAIDKAVYDFDSQL